MSVGEATHMTHAPENRHIRELVAARHDGYGLPREFYHGEALYQHELEHKYIKSNFDIYEDGHGSARIQQHLAEAVARSESAWQREGMAISHVQGGPAAFPDARIQPRCVPALVPATVGLALGRRDGCVAPI